MIDAEIERDKRMAEWSQGYLDLMREECRYTDIYTESNEKIPKISQKLQSLRTKIFRFTDLVRPKPKVVEKQQPSKEHKKKSKKHKHSRENPESEPPQVIEFCEAKDI